MNLMELCCIFASLKNNFFFILVSGIVKMLIHIIIKSNEALPVGGGGGPCSLPKFDLYDVTIIFNFKWNHCKIQNIDLYFQYNLHMLWYHFRRSVEANWDWIHLKSNSFPISSPICTGILGYISGQFLSSYLLIDYIFITKDFDDPDLFFFSWTNCFYAHGHKVNIFYLQ